MANKNPQNKFEIGNTIGKLAKGKPKPTLHTTFKSFYYETLGKYTQEEIDYLIRQLPPQQQLFFLVEFAKQQKDHEEKMAKIELEKLKLLELENFKNDTQVIEIGYRSIE